MTTRDRPVTDRRLTGATIAPPMQEQFGFDPTHGFDLAELLAVTPPGDEPADLDAFWAGVADEATTIVGDVELGEWRVFEGGPDAEVADLRYRSLDDVWIGGWVTRPRSGATRALVVGHGYGGRDAPDLSDVPADAVAVFPVARGLPVRSEVRGIGDAQVA